MKIKVQYVHYMPKELFSGVLYVSKEYRTAAHLCACGCGLKVRTPLKDTEWKLKVTDNGPSLSPSVGNWQLPCKSHYVINEGSILWAGEWSKAQIELGREFENQRRKAYYSEHSPRSNSILVNIWNYLKKIFE